MNSDIRFYWSLLLRRLPVMTVIFGICAAIGLGLALTLPPRYEASASLLVESPQIPDELAASTVQLPSQEPSLRCSPSQAHISPPSRRITVAVRKILTG